MLNAVSRVVSGDVYCNTECEQGPCGGYHQQILYYSFYCLDNEIKMLGVQHNSQGYQNIIEGRLI